MPKIVITNIDGAIIESVEVQPTVLKLIQDNYIDWMHACGGKGRCTTCKMLVLKGQHNLTKRSEFENKMFNIQKLKDNERLACQCKLQGGEIEVEVPKENQLPHVSYTSDKTLS